MADWLGNSRTEILETCRNWLVIFKEGTANETGEIVEKSEAWGIPPSIIAELKQKFSAAEEALTLARNKETRTEVVNAQVNTTFTALEADMRMVKRRFGHIPPMTAADFVAMGWKIPDGHASPVGISRTVPVAVVHNPRPHVVRLRITPSDPTLFDKKTCDHAQVRFGVLDPAKEGRIYIKKIPVSADDLPEQEDRRRLNEEWVFGAEDAGKKVYFCLRYVNSKGEPGQWGPLIEAIIT